MRTMWWSGWRFLIHICCTLSMSWCVRPGLVLHVSVWWWKMSGQLMLFTCPSNVMWPMSNMMLYDVVWSWKTPLLNGLQMEVSSLYNLVWCVVGVHRYWFFSIKYQYFFLTSTRQYRASLQGLCPATTQSWGCSLDYLGHCGSEGGFLLLGRSEKNSLWLAVLISEHLSTCLGICTDISISAFLMCWKCEWDLYVNSRSDVS